MRNRRPLTLRMLSLAAVLPALNVPALESFAVARNKAVTDASRRVEKLRVEVVKSIVVGEP